MTAPARVLVVEDEFDIRQFVRVSLVAEGFDVVEAGGLRRGGAEATAGRPDIAIIDIGLPDGSGIDLIRDIRTWSSMPIIVISARSQEQDKVAGLDAGADDYLTKPFAMAELLARVRAHLRRSARDAAPGDAIFRTDAFSLDLLDREVRRHGDIVNLSRIEYRLLTTLVGQPDRVLTHGQLLKMVWGPDHQDKAHYVRIYVGRLRDKLEDDSSRPRHFMTEPGVGYRFVP